MQTSFEPEHAKRRPEDRRSLSGCAGERIAGNQQYRSPAQGPFYEVREPNWRQSGRGFTGLIIPRSVLHLPTSSRRARRQLLSARGALEPPATTTTHAAAHAAARERRIAPAEPTAAANNEAATARSARPPTAAATTACPAVTVPTPTGMEPWTAVTPVNLLHKTATGLDSAIQGWCGADRSGGCATVPDRNKRQSGQP